MPETSYPVAVQPLDCWLLEVTFENGERRIFDAGPYLDDAFFAPLKDWSVFRSAKVGPVSVEWPGGIDICPDELYLNSLPAD
jgi:hypothetical protein